MGIINVETIEGVKQEQVHNINDFPYNDCKFFDIVRKSKRCQYYNVATAFDIETTTIDGKKANNGEYITNPYGFMYQWQFCYNDMVVFGRTWEEFTTFFNRLSQTLELTLYNRLVVYVHNLQFEFQFMKEFLDIDSIFAKDKRKPLKVVTKNGIEFRCSYSLSNMSLSKFCENSEGCTYYKLTDSYDYKKLRTPSTELTETEKAYCYNDVRGLCQCINSLMIEDNLATIPLTNTGYVRREFRNAMNTKEDRQRFINSALTKDMYLMLKDAFRGGNTHANRYKANLILNDVYSFDISSSYPFTMNTDYYPMGKFMFVRLNNIDKIKFYTNNYCVIMSVTFENIRAKVGNVIPYLDLAHCKERVKYINDNGRVLSAQYVTVTLTEIDFNIICETYDFDRLIVNKAMYCNRGKLPETFRRTMMKFYELKTQLKGIEEKEYEYMKSKNRLNSSFGMTVTDMVHSIIEYDSMTLEWNEEKADIEESLSTFYRSRNNFLPYQWGVYVTAHARKNLQKMLNIVGEDVIYCDTDSIKFIGKHHIKEFEEENAKIIKRCNKNDIPCYATDKKGVKIYLGVWDNDGNYERFKTLGAKKYCFFKKDKEGLPHFVVTVSGMNKKKGAKAVRCCKRFNIGETFKDIGRMTSWYNDEQIHTITVNNETFTTASNIGMLDTTYTLGVTNEYWELIGENGEWIDS